MKRLLIVAAIAVIAAPVLASPDILPVKGIAGQRLYDMATGQQTPAGFDTRVGPVVWDSTQSSGYFWGGQGAQEIALDWGDFLGVPPIGGFGWGYATNGSNGLSMLLTFYTDDNGWNQKGRDIVAGFLFTGLNGTITPTNCKLFWGWMYRAELFTPFILAANDLDGDGLGDFSYTYWFDHATLHGCANAVIGPLIAGDPNAPLNPGCPGVENAFDIYNDPNYIPAPGYFDPNLTHYVGSYWFGGVPFAQFYMELMAGSCPNKGDSGRYCEADIANFDCMVGLPDLAQLLGNYGCTTGCTVLMGDVDPYDRWFPGDGVIGLGDLAELLGQYGDNCNWPQP
jgi:hypothetical protein